MTKLSNSSIEISTMIIYYNLFNKLKTKFETFVLTYKLLLTNKISTSLKKKKHSNLTKK